MLKRKHCGLISYAGRSCQENKAAFFGASESSYPQVNDNAYWKTFIMCTQVSVA